MMCRLPKVLGIRILVSLLAAVAEALDGVSRLWGWCILFNSSRLALLDSSSVVVSTAQPSTSPSWQEWLSPATSVKGDCLNMGWRH